MQNPVVKCITRWIPDRKIVSSKRTRENTESFPYFFFIFKLSITFRSSRGNKCIEVNILLNKRALELKDA